MILYGYPPKETNASGSGAARDADEKARRRTERKSGLYFQGVLTMLEQNFAESESDTYREWMTQYMSPISCSVCNERRLRSESLAVKIAGRSISEYVALSISRMLGPPWTQF